MTKLKIIIYVISVSISSLILGTGISYYIGSTLPEKSTLISTKSFEATKNLIWAALLDIESYPLWKPGLKHIEMLGTNEDGLTKWREFYPLGKVITYEITEYIPKTLIEFQIIETNKAAEGVWIYKLSNYEERGVLQVKRFAIVKSKLERFIRRYIDAKYSETDYFLISLNIYLNQLLEDKEEVLELIDAN